MNFDFFDLLKMIGGLALFLYGMHMLSEGLEKISGGKLERILEKMTDSRWKAVLLGAGVTAVIQSSSATTVMVVGFVNSGIMKLSQAIGVIMGANVGTTITSWLLSLTGLEGDSFLLKLIKPTSFSPVLAIIGVVFIVFLKNAKKRDIGGILVGFAILMTGMNTMSDAMKPLSENPTFTGLFTMFANPFLGLIGVRRYFAGALCNGKSDVCVGGADYFGTKYRNLRDCDDVGRRRRKECETRRNHSFNVQRHRCGGVYGSVLYNKFRDARCLFGRVREQCGYCACPYLF